MKRNTVLTLATTWMKFKYVMLSGKARLQMPHTTDSIYMMFWRRQNDEGKQMSGCQGRGWSRE
jgi:hypothetical protein